MLLRAITFVAGVAGAALPEKSIEIGKQSMLVGYENPEDLEASQWYVSLARTEGILLAATGALSIALEVGLSSCYAASSTSIDVEDAA